MQRTNEMPHSKRLQRYFHFSQGMAEETQPKQPQTQLALLNWARKEIQAEKLWRESKGETRVNIGFAFQRWWHLRELKVRKMMSWLLFTFIMIMSGVFILLNGIMQSFKFESDVLRSSLCSVMEQLWCGGVWAWMWGRGFWRRPEGKGGFGPSAKEMVLFRSC